MEIDDRYLYWHIQVYSREIMYHIAKEDPSDGARTTWTLPPERPRQLALRYVDR
jgi:hypothetical protein